MNILVIVICGHIAISVFWGNAVYCVKLSGEDLSRYVNKIESAALRKCPYYHCFTMKVMSQQETFLSGISGISGDGQFA